jgi:cyclophilin family peptidyl-prolyl cis-trans isomerase
MPNPTVSFKTSLGSFQVELFADKSPLTAANFVDYVKAGFYDGMIFHRVIPGFMVQGGGMSPGLKEKSTQAPIKNEADNGVLNTRGSIAMARTSDPNSATSQFFINLADNAFLDFKSKDSSGWGYCAFGAVSGGMDTIDAIAKVETGNKGFHQNVPRTEIVIESVTVA